MTTMTSHNHSKTVQSGESRSPGLPSLDLANGATSLVYGEVLKFESDGLESKITLLGLPKNFGDVWEKSLAACTLEAGLYGKTVRFDVAALAKDSVSMDALGALFHMHRAAADASLRVTFDNVPKAAAQKFDSFRLPVNHRNHLDINSVLLPSPPKL